MEGMAFLEENKVFIHGLGEGIRLEENVARIDKKHAMKSVPISIEVTMIKIIPQLGGAEEKSPAMDVPRPLH